MLNSSVGSKSVGNSHACLLLFPYAAAAAAAEWMQKTKCFLVPIWQVCYVCISAASINHFHAQNQVHVVIKWFLSCTIWRFTHWSSQMIPQLIHAEPTNAFNKHELCEKYKVSVVAFCSGKLNSIVLIDDNSSVVVIELN